VTAPAGFQVATDSLRTEAGVWDQQAQQIKNIADKADGLRFTRLEAGIFQLIVTPYSEVVDAVVTRCREGSQQMVDIANTLRNVAKIYDEEEKNHEHKMRKLW